MLPNCSAKNSENDSRLPKVMYFPLGYMCFFLVKCPPYMCIT